MLSTKSNTKKIGAAIIVIIVLIAIAGAYIYLTRPTEQRERKQLIVSTTTSLYETGFLDILKATFEKEYPNINVSFISQGTGLAIETAKRGDADMILVHDPARELQFLKDGVGVNRKILAYNFFVIVGPADDPASIKGLDPLSAMQQIKEGNASWISRGDGSGTHSKEGRLWKTAGYNMTLLRDEAWYFEAGSGMTATLKMADEKQAYTITDLGSYLMNYNNGNIKLVVLVEGGYDLLNVYSAIACDPRNNNTNKANFEASMTFIRFMASDQGQKMFDDFGVSDYGQSLFKPAIKLLKDEPDSQMAQWIKKYAIDPFGDTECPPEYRYQEGDLYMMALPLTMVRLVTVLTKP
jgi:tungstate transport system substrate-binding protein